jgi:hypothetical protein
VSGPTAASFGRNRVEPIRSFPPHRFEEFFDRVELHDDGVWWMCRFTKPAQTAAPNLGPSRDAFLANLA